MMPARDIDGWLVSEETGRAFSHCANCRLPLVEIARPWLVTKDFSGGECVLEYAVCQPCRDGVTARLSEESKAAVRRFLETEIDWQERVREFMLATNPAERFGKCIACEMPRDELDGFGISALYDSSGELVTGPLPLLICRGCVARMTMELSDQSRAVWRDFLERNFDGPPDESAFSGLM